MRTPKHFVQEALRALGLELTRCRDDALPPQAPDADHLKRCEAIARDFRAKGLDKVHYACGAHFFGEHWINVDAADLSRQARGFFLRVDLLARHPFPSDFFKYAFAEDFLEHLGQADSIIFLCEAFRTLQKSGVLRLSFPGLAGVLRKHYGRTDYYEACRGRREAFTMWGHLHFYSEETLTLVARHIGFSQVRYVAYGESEHPDLRNLDSRAKQKDLNIYAELTK